MSTRLSRIVASRRLSAHTVRSALARHMGWLLPDWVNPGRNPRGFAPAKAGEGLPDYVVWAVIGWHFRFQRPQQLARELARSGRRVFFVSSDFISDSRAGMRIEPLDGSGRLFQVFLRLRGAPSIYYEMPGERAVEQLRGGIGMLTDWASSDRPISLVEHPYWFPVVTASASGPVVYDRMDYHPGFGTFSRRIAEAEEDLMRDADLTVVSSSWLNKDSARFTVRRALIRNGADFSHFSRVPENPYRDPNGRRIIGYYGSLAGWMDFDLVSSVAERFSDCAVVLIGHDQVGASRKFSARKNVVLLGEVPYSELPRYLHGFDVCLLPRTDTPLTQAMNPVKLYEYLCAGKPVVARELPELVEFGDLVYRAQTADEFLRHVARALAESPSDPLVERRREFAAEQTWERRARDLIQAVEMR